MSGNRSTRPPSAVRGRRRTWLLLPALAFPLWYGLVVVAQTLIGDDPIDWFGPLWPVLGSFLGTVIAWWAASWAQRRAGREAERRLLRTVRTAMRTGRLPPDPDPTVWAPLLHQEHRAHRRRMRTVLAVQLALAVVVLAVLVFVVDLGVSTLLITAVVSGQLINLVWSAGQRHQQRAAGLLSRLPAASGRQPSG